MPSDIIRGAGTGARERRLVNSPFRILLVRLCSSLLKPGQRDRGTGKGGDVHGQNVPLGTSVDAPSKLTLASSWRRLAALKAKWNGRRKHSRDFLLWNHWSSIRSRRSARGNCPTGSEVPAHLSTRIASWEPSTTAPRDALYSLREDDRQSGADEERGPDVKTFSSCTSFHEDR